MANKEFEQQQILKAYRKGLISDELFAAQMAELGVGKNGKSAMNGSAQPMKMNGSAQPEKTYDRAAEDLGNIVALEHVNVTVPNQELANRFYIDGLGLTRDPYMMTGPNIMWVNVGRSQFHLPASTAQVLRGHTGVVMPDRASLLKRLTRARKHLEGTKFDFCEMDGYVEAVCPWGNHIRCFEPQERFWPHQPWHSLRRVRRSAEKCGRHRALLQANHGSAGSSARRSARTLCMRDRR